MDARAKHWAITVVAPRIAREGNKIKNQDSIQRLDHNRDTVVELSSEN